MMKLRTFALTLAVSAGLPASAQTLVEEVQAALEKGTNEFRILLTCSAFSSTLRPMVERLWENEVQDTVRMMELAQIDKEVVEGFAALSDPAKMRLPRDMAYGDVMDICEAYWDWEARFRNKEIVLPAFEVERLFAR